MKGQPHRFGASHLLVDNGRIHEQMLEIFSEVFQGRFRVPVPEIRVERP